MEGPTSSAAEKPAPTGSDADAQVSKSVDQKRSSQIEADAERIRASVARLTSSSINGLEGLSAELQQLQGFLNSEVERVQGHIDSALAGIKIIVETIAPWQSTLAMLEPPGVRAARAGPAANRPAAQGISSGLQNRNNPRPS
jgi:hypothetical protein